MIPTTIGTSPLVAEFLKAAQAKQQNPNPILAMLMGQGQSQNKNQRFSIFALMQQLQEQAQQRQAQPRQRGGDGRLSAAQRNLVAQLISQGIQRREAAQQQRRQAQTQRGAEISQGLAGVVRRAGGNPNPFPGGTDLGGILDREQAARRR